MTTARLTERRHKPGVFRSAITGTDGAVDVGYLTMFLLIVIFGGAVPCMITGAFIEMIYGVPVVTTAGAVVGFTHEFKVSGLGAGIGFAAGGLSTALGAVALFRKADAGPAQQPQRITEQTEQRTTVVEKGPTP